MGIIWSIVVVALIGTSIGCMANSSNLCGPAQLDEEKQEGHIDVYG